MTSSEAKPRRDVVTFPLVGFGLALLLFTLLSILPTFSTTPKHLLSGVSKPSAGATSQDPTSQDAAAAAQTSAVPPPTIVEEKPYYLQDLVDYKIPKIDLEQLSKYPPRNYQGAGNPAYATFFITRNGTLHDPIFISAQQLVYRILWAQDQRSEKYPVVIFVLPFVPELQRQYFRAAGALVVEVEERAFTATVATIAHYRDQFAKLDMWSQLGFSHLLYMDADALSWNNLDSIFEFGDQRCKEDLLAPEDAQRKDEICDYEFAAWVNRDDGEINAGVMLIQPNVAMYDRLVREFMKVNGHIGGTNEQGFLNSTFDEAGAFPRRVLSDEWNGGHKEGDHFYILHAKPWVMNEGEIAWIGKNFKQTWDDLVKLYESAAFVQQRMADRDRAMANGWIKRERDVDAKALRRAALQIDHR